MVSTPDDRALRYEHEHARGLRALAYRMLGSRAEAEDVVQEAWLRWSEVDEGTIQQPRPYLSRLVTNLCLDRLGSATARREQYVGVWLPEPLLDADDGWSPGPEAEAEFAHDVSVAFMLTLERLSPLERAAFLLHDVFDLDFDEVSRHLGRNAAACRQLASRARAHIKANHVRRDVAPEEHDRLFRAFSHAVAGFDVDGLARVLADDAVLLTDGGGKVSAVSRPLHGNARIAKALIGFARLAGGPGWRLEPARVNGLPGCLAFDPHTGRLMQTIALAPAVDQPGRIGAIYIQRNPDKLQGVPRAPAGSRKDYGKP